MGVYSVMVADSKIAKGVAGCKSVIIVGCSACANDSLPFDKDYPLAKIVVDKDTGKTLESPVSTLAEANRLKKLLESHGISVEIETWFGLCLLAYDIEKDMMELVNRCARAEAVITLCCAGGTLGLKRLLPQGTKIVPGMKTVGVFQICKVLDKAGEFVRLDKDRSTAIPMFKEK